ncbi:MAG TPA: hypothetical protein PLF13_09565 [candidate division Zixibacteria bacterium]|nr:hypothetical protein [candidate division Zixibacteria bacterium]
MSSGDTPEDVHLTDVSEGTPAVSGGENVHQLAPVEVDVLEFEDGLFHSGSCVMMPKIPIEADDDEDEGQQCFAGIDSIALVLRQLVFSPERKLLITGHTDSQGAVDYNFVLSQRRAKNIRALLKDDREDYGRVCYAAHKVIDCKQILKYFHQSRRWPCNPGDVNNTWNRDTEQATESFIRYYNTEFADRNDIEPLNSRIMTDIRRDDRHRWPRGLWEAVFDLYQDDLKRTLGVDDVDLELMRPSDEQFISELHEYVGCAFSFPRSDDYDEEYRSETDRRVEVIFFRTSEAPTEEQMTCPAELDDLHTEQECPIWSQYFMLRTYINPAELHAVPYHLRLKYYDRVKKELCDLPDGINFEAYVGDNRIPSRTIFNEGLYTVVVQFPTADEARTNANNVQLKFTATNEYVYRSAADANATIVEKLPDEFNGLSIAEKLKHYDLPAAWRSRNWRCKVGTTVDDYEHHVTTRTTGDDPIVFNLDDLVLLSAVDGSQALQDRNGDTSTTPNGTVIALSKDSNPGATPPQWPSRVRILYVDPQDNKMKVYSTNPSGSKQEQHDGSIIRFQTNHANDAVRNFIKDPPGGTRVVVFCGDFYDVSNRRTAESDTGFNYDNGHVLGARVALLDDEAVHRQEAFTLDETTQIVHATRIGDFILHYLHGGGFDNQHQYSFVVVQWNGYVFKDTAPSNGTTASTTAPTDAQVNEFRSVGMFNAMEHWNKKSYEFVPHNTATGTGSSPSGGSASSGSGGSSGSGDSTPAPLTPVVRPFFFLEAFECIKLLPPTPAVNFRNDTAALLAHANFTTALRQARGGVPRSLVFVTEEDKGSWVMSYREGGKYSVISLRVKTRQDDVSRFTTASFESGTAFPVGEFNDPGGNSSYGCLVIAHELGHATGQIDDYLEDAKYYGADPPSYPVPNYGQFGVRSNNRRMHHSNQHMNNRNRSSEAWVNKHDDKTMMDKNGPIRMRHVWRFCHWMNEKGQTGQDLYDFLNGQRFEIHYPNPSPAMSNYYRNGTDQPKDPWQFVASGTINAAANRPMNVYLYKTLDEVMRVPRTSGGGTIDCKAILVVRPLFSVCFENTTHGNWTEAQRKSWCYGFYKYFIVDKNLLPNKFMINGSGTSDEIPVLLKFLPGFDFYASGGNPAHNNQNYKIVVKWNSDAVSQSGNQLTVGGANARMKDLFYYMFNKPASSTGFAVADFNFIRDWYNGRTTPAGTYSIQEV